MNTTRRRFLKRAVYVAPAVMTMAALPAIASSGSGITVYDDDKVRSISTGKVIRWQSRTRRKELGLGSS